MRRLSEAAPAGSAAWTEPPARPPREGRETGLDQASHQELDLARRGKGFLQSSCVTSKGWEAFVVCHK